MQKLKHKEIKSLGNLMQRVVIDPYFVDKTEKKMIEYLVGYSQIEGEGEGVPPEDIIAYGRKVREQWFRESQDLRDLYFSCKEKERNS